MNPRHRLRFAVVYLFFVVALGAVLFRLTWVQLVRHGFYAGLAATQQHERNDLPAARGAIYDRNMNPLAMSRPLFNVYCLPRLVKDRAGAARVLAPVLGVPENALVGKLGSRAASEWLARGVPAPLATKALALGVEGVFALPCERRVYPEGTLASHVLGYMGARDGSRAGLERTLNVYLEGLPGVLEGGADAAGRALPDLTHDFVPPMHGFGCVLTIDKWCQYVAERELAATCVAYGAAGGAVVVMRPDTGEVLALASYPRYDPNAYGRYPPSAWRNNGIMSAIEPGSIIKPFLVAAALEERAIAADDVFDCSRPVTFGRYRIADVKPVAHPLTVTEILTHSSNIGVTQIAARLGGRRYYDYLRSFGFGVRTGVPLPAENPGIVRSAEFERPLGNAFASFGQGLSATPLQIAAAACALANGGVVYEPMLVSAVVDGNGRAIRRFSPRPLRRVLSPATAARVLAMMELVVAEGGGKLGQVPGYRVAGKTGTSEVAADGVVGYTSGVFNASFLGIAPADDPRVVVFVTIQRPRGKVFGGEVAAPAFARIARDILPALKVPPAGSGNLPEVAAAPRPTAPITCSGVPAAAALKDLSGLGLKARLDGRGEGILWSSIDGSVLPPPGDVVFVKLDGVGAMPAVVGLSVREAMRELGPLGVKVNVEGAGGWVVGQAPRAGAKPGKTCVLKLGTRPPVRPRPPQPVGAEKALTAAG